MDEAVKPYYAMFAREAKRYGVAAARDRLSSLGPGAIDQLTAAFEEALSSVEEGGPPVIAAAGQEDWYSGPDTEFGLWPSFKAALERKDWSDEVIDSIDRASTQVVAHTPRPDGQRWDSKGLVVGYVQSGKTTNFTSVIAKLVDEEYDLVIVLSGIHNSLRKQTQQRLDKEIKEAQPQRVITLTDDERDFHVPPSLPSAQINPNNDSVVLIVAKKNVVVLRKLIKWLDNTNGKQALQAAKCLVIDDEADQASVATGRTNPLILKLLSLMPRCTYIGYTATPFANVFIDPASDDLYPKDFILNLPHPEGYFGPEVIFGRNESETDSGAGNLDGYDMVRHIPEGDLPKLRPVGQGTDEGFSPIMTDELVDAVRWFWLATAARRARGDRSHSTILIHTSVKTQVHQSYVGPLGRLRDQALAELDDPSSDLSPWRALWEQETARVPAGDWGRQQDGFDDVVRNLRHAVADSRVIMDNSLSLDRLDYDNADSPLTVIAVGGNTLSRGLTLEGLVSSFFVRSATTYDTLLQMGRWFGFRPGYEDLARIWMTPELELQFRHLALVEHEMRQDINAYQLQNRTPLEIAVRIRTHPSMRITAKMGAAAPTFLSYAGRRMQTRYFKTRDQDWLDVNRAAAEKLLDAARRVSSRQEVGSAVLYRDVPVGNIKTFLGEYRIHEDSPDMDPEMMLRYIERQLENEQPLVERWSVAVVTGTGESIEFGGESLKTVIRSRLRTTAVSDADYADIKTLMSKPDIALDMSLSQAEAKTKGEAQLKAARQDDPLTKDRGLLILYPIDKVSATDKPGRESLDALDTVVGLGLMFPGDADVTNQIVATHMAVDLSGVEKIGADELAALDADTEGGGLS